MKNSNQKKENKKGSVNAVFAAVTGAIVGASVAVAGAVALKDKKNQNKVKKIFTDVKNKTQDYLKKIETPEIIKGKKKIKKIVKYLK